MITAELRRDSGILTLKPSGKLEAQDFANLTKLVDPFISENKRLKGIIIEAERFPGWKDFAALSSHVSFIREHHKLIEKIAVVSDDKFLSKAPEVAKHFVRAKIRHFDLAQRSEALKWITASEQAQPSEQTL